MNEEAYKTGRRVALASMVASGTLAVAKLIIGWLAGSTAAVADGVESAGDVLTSGIVFVGLLIGRRPPDEDHPYGHGRAEAISGLIIGVLLAVTGGLIAWNSLQDVGQRHTPPHSFALWPLSISVIVKSVLSFYKMRIGRRLNSTALVADAWNDAVDILSALLAITALGLTVLNPDRFLAADHFGGFAIGGIIITTGLRVVREVATELMDRLPATEFLERVGHSAMTVTGVHAVEKCWARKSGLSYLVDIHVEVDPNMTVRESHRIAHELKDAIIRDHPSVANVLVHIEPAGGVGAGDAPAMASPRRGVKN